MRTPGTRVGAILSADKETVRLLGYGTYIGNEIPPEGPLHKIGIPNPKIQLDNGDVVWGYQCWWGDEEEVKCSIGGRQVIEVKISDG